MISSVSPLENEASDPLQVQLEGGNGLAVRLLELLRGRGLRRVHRLVRARQHARALLVEASDPQSGP